MALLCVRQAAKGGVSTICSSVSVMNEMLKRRPDLAALLFEPYYRSRHGEEAETAEDVYALPVFGVRDGRFTSHFSLTYIEAAQTVAGVPRLTDAQKEALDLLLALAKELALEMTLDPGDIQFLNSHVTYHGRTPFEDDKDTGRDRLLMRLWLAMPNSRALPAGHEVLWRSTDAGALRGGIARRRGALRDSKPHSNVMPAPLASEARERDQAGTQDTGMRGGGGVWFPCLRRLAAARRLHGMTGNFASIRADAALIRPADAMAAVGAERHVDPACAVLALALVAGEQLGLVEGDAGRRLPLVAVGGHLGERPALLLRDDGQHPAARRPQAPCAKAQRAGLGLLPAPFLDAGEDAAVLLDDHAPAGLAAALRWRRRQSLRAGGRLDVA